MFTIQDKSFNSLLIQGPLAGVSCAPFRKLAWQWGQPAYCYTEMISSHSLVTLAPEKQRRYTYKDPAEGVLCYQLSGNHAGVLAEAAQIVTELGADLIDLNCGCPVKKIRAKGAGSGLLATPDQLHRFISAMKAHTQRPVGVKIRVDANSDDHFNQAVAQALIDAQADFVTVHGRHWTQRYDVDCSYADIAYFVDALPMPVIGNGDVACPESLQKMLATGCAAAMIARAGVGQPWLTKQLHCAQQAQTFAAPGIAQVGQILLQHMRELADLLANDYAALMQMRSVLKYYVRAWPIKADFTADFMACTCLEKAQQLIKIHFKFA